MTTSSATSISGRGIDTARPFSTSENGMAAQLTGTEHQHRDTLWTVAVLVAIGRNGRDAREAEVKQWQLVASVLSKWQQETAHARVDVHGNVVLNRQIRNHFQLINQSVRKLWC